MDKRTHLLYTPAITQTILERFDIDPQTLRALDGFESFIYQFQKDTRPYILRISHSLHHPPQRTQGEMDFLHYLASHGLAVPHPQPSRLGNLVEVIEVPAISELPETSYFSAAVFDFAPGRPPRGPDWNPVLFTTMGRFLGRLHALTRHYTPSRPEWRRHFWYEDQEDYAVRYLPSSEAVIIEKFASLSGYLKALPQDPAAFGLIHVDFHGGNFFIEPRDGAPYITLFDFDDCCYAHFAYDLAMALFYVVPHHCDSPEDRANAQTFYDHLLEGYLEAYPLDRRWLKEIPHFLKLREFDLYSLIHRSFDLDNLTPWTASFMDERKARLENDVPYVDIDFHTD